MCRSLQPHDDVWITQVISRGPLRTTGAPTVVILTEPLPFASFARYHKLGVSLLTPGIRHTPSTERGTPRQDREPDESGAG